tara:strand:- start:367 stop:1860 length:1494 start_codon:yes stop_codon:yes gene_type:complete
MTKNQFIVGHRTEAWVCVVLACIFSIQVSAETSFDLVIANGRVIDPASSTDAMRHVGIIDNRIVAVSEMPLSGTETIDAKGKVVTAGFIDLHSHAQTQLGQQYQVRDGVTTALDLEAGAYPVAAVANNISDQALINFGASASYASMRAKVLSNTEQPYIFFAGKSFSFKDAAFTKQMDEAEIVRAMRHVGLGIDQGGLGIGLLLDYLDAAVSDGELEALFTTAADRRAPLFIHIRRGMAGDPSGLIEVIELAKRTGASIHICHLSASAMGGIDNFLELVDEALAAGVDISAESYPYNAGSTSIGADVFNRDWKSIFGITYSDVQLAETGEFFTKARWDEVRAEDPGATIIHHYGREDWTQRAMVSSAMMIGSDAMPIFSKKIKSHPRAIGTFSRVLAEYVRGSKILSLSEALSKMSYLPAKRLEGVAPRFKRKGRIQPGADADIVIFDVDSIRDRATYDQPYSPSTGITAVIVNGQLVVNQGIIVPNVFPGRIVIGG